MKRASISLITCGTPGANLAAVQQLLHAAGIAPALPASAGSITSISQWHDRLFAGQPQALGTIEPGKPWELAAGEIFLGNWEQAAWGWTDHRSTWLLDYWRDFDPSTRFVLVYTPAQDILTHALATVGGAPFDDKQLLANWCAYQTELLAFYHRNRSRCVLSHAHTVFQHTAAWLDSLNQTLGTELSVPHSEQPGATPLDPLTYMVVHALLLDQPEVLALEAEILATLANDAQPTAVALPDVSAASEHLRTLHAAFAELRQHTQQLEHALRAQIDHNQLTENRSDQLKLSVQQLQQQLEQRARERDALTLQVFNQINALATETKAKTEALAQLHAESQARQDAISQHLKATQRQEHARHALQIDNDRLESQLRNTQEDLEQQFLTAERLTSARDANAKGRAEALAERDALHQEKIRLTAACDALSQEKTSLIAQHTAATQQQEKARQELQQESELLLLQLHQVQEELEQYFLQHQQVSQEKDQLTSQLAQTSAARDAEAAAKAAALTQRDAEAKAKSEAIAQRDALATEKATLIAARDTLTAEKTKLVTDLEAQTKAKQAAITQRDAEAAAKAAALTQRDAEAKAKSEATAQRDALATEKATLIAARDALAAEKTKLVTDLEAQTKAKQATLAQRDAEATAKAAALTQRDSEVKAKSEAIAQRDALASEKATLVAARDALSQEKTTLIAQHTAATQQQEKARQELQQESELLLLQLHQVQEELEHYFLRHQQVNQEKQQLAARLDKLLTRFPDFAEWDRIDIIADATPATAEQAAARQLHCHIHGLKAGGRTAPLLDLTLDVTGKQPVLLLAPPIAPATSPLLFWPTAAAEDGSLLPLLLDPSAQPATPAAQTLRNCTLADLQLIRAAYGALADGLPATLPGRGTWVQQLATMRQQLAALPATWRFDAVQLKHQQVNPDYEHLWFALTNASFGSRHWPNFEFRLSAANIKRGKFSQHPKLEFPLPALGDKQFENWFEESEDDRGPKYELRFDSKNKGMDLTAWQALSPTDQAHAVSLCAQLPVLLQRLQTQGTKIARPWTDWQAMASAIQQALSHSLRPPTAPAPATAPAVSAATRPARQTLPPVPIVRTATK